MHVVTAPNAARSNAGFTLIELLVVISIIVLLIAILLPALQKARVTAQAIACGSNLRQVGVTLYVYGNDSNGAFPCALVGSGHGSVSGQSPWHNLVKNDYIQDRHIWDCPADTTTKPREANGFYPYSWTRQGGKPINRSYVFNETAGLWLTASIAWPVYRPARSDAPSHDPIVFDFENGPIGSNAYRFGYEYFKNAWPPDSSGASYFPSGGRHNNAINILAGDGSVHALNVVQTPYATVKNRWPNAVTRVGNQRK